MNLEAVLDQYKDRRFVFVEPGGNQGDHMIYAGARKLADQLDLKYRTIICPKGSIPAKIKASDVIYLHGGGGFIKCWNWTPRLLKRLRARNPTNLVIVGPTTVAKQLDYLKMHLPKKDNLIFFARERTSYEYLKKHFYPDAKIDHDTALKLSMGDGYLERLAGNLTAEENHRLLAIRRDAESPKTLPRTLRREEFDIATDPVRERDRWAWLHFKASSITTNRSHSAILGSILGKPTTLFAGGYHKNKSIWEYSLKQKGVKWIG